MPFRFALISSSQDDSYDNANTLPEQMRDSSGIFCSGHVSYIQDILDLQCELSARDVQIVIPSCEYSRLLLQHAVYFHLSTFLLIYSFLDLGYPSMDSSPT
jgi:hypothetical protein